MGEEEADVSAAAAAGGGGGLLARISNEMVATQKRFYGKGPTQPKSYMVDDMLFIVMRGGFTTAELTMLEFGQTDLVRQFRQIFQNEMGDRLIGMIEDVTGRKVLAYQSQVLFGPNIALEVFVFDRTDESGGTEATGQGQITGEDMGVATDADALEPPDATPE